MKARSIFLLAAAGLMALAACNKHEVVHHGGNNGNGNGNNNQPDPKPTYTFNLQANDSWNIGYLGRQDLEENDGSVIPVDVIDVSGVTADSYLVSVISRDNYASYNGDVAQFLKDEAQYNNEYVYDAASQVINFDPFRHGTWYGFIIGLHPDKSASGEYAYAKFEVLEETPKEDYLKWIGKWNISDGQGIFYPLVISQLEANYIYRVDGWETGSSIDKKEGTVMDQEYLETFYDAPTGSLYFTSQYIQSYTDDSLGDMDECFLGQIDYDGITQEMGLYIITDEGLDLAEARMAEGGKFANVLPCSVRASVGDETFETNFYNMQYFGYAVDNQQWYPYNDNVPGFPMTMTKVEDGGDQGDNPPAKVGRRSVKKASMPARAKVHVSKADRPAAKAVRVR
ncbi:MAG: hypothetical protein LIQ26_02520 [Bacteroidota bacterium]|nr:hypothetical protein [Bacteroidota bacterium]